jgi:TP901 family phage tail tape measure protein
MAFSIGRGTLLGVGYISVTADTGDAEAKLGLLGKGLGIAAGAFTVLAAAAVGTTMVASKFNTEMLKIQTQAGGTAGDVKTLSSQILNMKGAQQGPMQLADAMYHLKSVGMTNVDAMKSLKVASDLAALGGSNLEATTNALAGAWRSGIKGAQTFSMAAGTVNAIIGAGNMRMEDFVAAIGTGILPAAKTFGVGLNQIGAALALMTDEGVPATDAATRLKMSLSLLAAPSNVASKQLAKIGLTGLQLANTMRGPSGLVGAVQLLKDHLDASGLSASQQAILLSHAFGGGRSSSAILTMINNVGVLHGKLDQINNSAGKLPASIAAQQKTLSAQLHMFESTMEANAIKTGELLIGPATKFVTFVNATLIPAIGNVTRALKDMVPVSAIKTGFSNATSGLAALVGGVKSVFAGPAKAVSAAAPRVTGPSSTYLSQVPGYLPAVAAPRISGAYSSQVPGFSTAVLPRIPTVSRSSTFQSQVPTAPGRAANPFLQAYKAPALSTPKAPDVSGWAKAGQVIGTALSTIGSIAATTLPPVGHALLTLGEGIAKIVMPAFSIVATFVTSFLVPSLKNIAVFVAPLLGLLQPLAVLVGGLLLVAFTAVGMILNNVLGPALRAVTGFMAENKTLVTSLGIVFGIFTAGLLVLNGGMIVLRIQLAALAIQQALLGIATKGLAIAQAALNLVMDANPIGLVVIAVAALAAGFYYAWTHSATFRTIVEDTFNGIKTVAVTVFDFLTKGLGQFTLLLLGPIGVLALLAIHWRDTWTVMKDVALAVAGWFAGPFVGFFVAIGSWFAGPFVGFFLGVGHWFSHDFVGFFVDMWHLIEGVLRFLVNGFLSVASAIVHGAATMFGWVPGVGGQLKAAAKQFDVFRDSVNAALGGVQPKTVPVTVSFNGVNQGQITGNTFTSTTGFTYAKGGKIPGWLGTPNKDSVPILAMGGEFIVNKQSTKKHQKLLEAINSGDVKTYARGGMVGFSRAATGDMSLAAHRDIAAEVKVLAEAYAKAYNSSTFPRGLAWARTQVGMPYQWGGNGNPSWDCSGYMSAIESVIRGEAPHRRWATGAFSGATAPPNWRLNAQSPFMIGITNAGVGHTAGTLLGTNVEMTVPSARVGGASRGAFDGMFPDHYGLVGFDRGGWLKPGVNHVWNGTGRPERVPNPTRGHDGELHVHVHNHGVIGSQREMQDWLSESLDELNRRGRLRGLTGP